jgi:uncharacterized protein YukE
MAGNMSETEFKADLQQLHDAMGTVNGKSSDIKDSLALISGKFGDIEAVWKSPSGVAFDDMKKWFTQVASDVHAVLDEMARRMGTAYANYHDAESTNYRNLSAGPGGPRGRGGAGPGGRKDGGHGHGGDGHTGDGHGGDRRSRRPSAGRVRPAGTGTPTSSSALKPRSDDMETRVPDVGESPRAGAGGV